MARRDDSKFSTRLEDAAKARAEMLAKAKARAEAAKEAAVIQLLNAYRVRGHLIADLDPLGVDTRRCGEAAAHFPRLDERKRRAARADAQNGCCGRGICHMRLII